ncbi:MAG: ComEC/Rec2 family competence protein, partial [Muribaculaceae bacterium]|nr:ComEC/Rec2 family competence protein [Muribaculaceae bacterium]
MATDQFKAAVYIPSMLPLARIGDRICVLTQLEPPVFTPDLPDEYDYASNLKRRGITATCIVSPNKINICRRENGVCSWLDDRRNNISDLLMNSAALNDEASALTVAILTGNDDYISDKWRGALSEAGIAHILALSGVHVAIIAWVTAIVLFPLTIMQLNKLRLIITILVLWSFAILTGLSDSVMRATIMTTIVLVALLLQRRTSVYNTLAFALLVILFVSPTSLYSIGFQLTFAAVLAIVSINPILCGKIDRRKHPYLFKIVVALATPVSAVIGTGII